MTLIERLEALSGPNFAVEQEIVRIINPQATRLTMPPAYTASIDAAMTLVPEGWGRMFNQSENGLHCNVCLARSYPTNAVVYSEAATPAIALCIASLRARSADNG